MYEQCEKIKVNKGSNKKIRKNGIYQRNGRTIKVAQKVDDEGVLSSEEKRFILGSYDNPTILNMEFISVLDDKKTIHYSGSIRKKKGVLSEIINNSTAFSSSSLKAFLSALGYYEKGKIGPTKTRLIKSSHLDTSTMKPKLPGVQVSPKFESHRINNMPINAETLSEVSKFVGMLNLNISNHEDQHLRELTHHKPHDLKPYRLTRTTAVIDSPELHEQYFTSINDQLNGKVDFQSALENLFKILKSMDRAYAGIRLDGTGTTIKIVHYSRDEETLLRMPMEKAQEPYLSSSLLKESPEMMSTFIDCVSYIKGLSKLQIVPGMNDNEIKKKLIAFRSRVRVNGESKDDYEKKVLLAEDRLRKKEKLLVTHKGISKGFQPDHDVKPSKYGREKYSIHNFDTASDVEYTPEKRGPKSISEFMSRARESKGKILLWGYAIAGFGDLGNFQMLFRELKRDPELSKRLIPYVCFYRYSIQDHLINKLLDPDINIVVHENASRQWDPNYGYKVSEAVIPSNIEYEIQYNVGSLSHTAPEENTLRVGEMGGMAGVTQVDDANFTGTTRGGVGYGVPEDQKPENSESILEFSKKLHLSVIGGEATSLDISEVIKTNYSLMMARENSQIVNQRPYYNTDEVDKAELRNVSVGNRSLALILKAMITQSSSSLPVIIMTGNVSGLRDAAKSIGVEISNPSKISFDINEDGSLSTKVVERYEIRVGGKKGLVVKGFFPNNYIHMIMKFSEMPAVYSGEGSMNEGMAYGNPGFMIPFYDFQVTLLLESGGIQEKLDRMPPSYYVQNSSTVFVKNSRIWNLNKFDVIKLKFPSEEEQLYIIIGVGNSQLKLKKMDKTEKVFDIKYYDYSSTAEKLGIVGYKLKGWAREWLNLIYGRDQDSIDVIKIGQQVKEVGGPNWFDLLKQGK